MLIQAEIERLEKVIEHLEAGLLASPEFDRPEQDDQARTCRAGWYQAIEAAQQQLAFYRSQLASV